MWQLELGNERIASLTQATCEFPWTYARLMDSPAFERFRPYFSDDQLWPDTPEFDALCEEVRAKGGFVLRDLTTHQAYHHVTLHQAGEDVWFRCY